ncbi:MAG: hypothetical protein Ct9H90mP16_10640 [Candidatus Poseidoniales archaeon]|nr:MAG: hypothetical protein Ct9H90mP16_10640 [Candidatus Poseidoniales archaeon]
MRPAITIVALLLFASLPIIDAESETIHLWSEEPPGNVLLWDDSGNLTNLDPELPIDIHLPSGNWTLVRLVDGIPQDNPLTFNQDTNASNFLSEVLEEPLSIAGDAHLDLLGTIEQAAELNATWSSTIVIPNTLGHPDLPDSHLGIEHQIASMFSGDVSLFDDGLPIIPKLDAVRMTKST